jgi:hypothetical protein
MFEQFVNGIFWDVALIVFFVGISGRILAVLRRGNRKDLAVPRNSGIAGAIMANIRGFYPRKEIAPRIRMQVIAGYMFHLGLFILLFFAAPHVTFIAEHITGFSWMTQLISRRSDHIASILVFIVMLTGCMALAQASTELRVFHRFAVELLMIYFPFSALMHAIMFAPSRAYTGAWHGRRGVKV